MTGRYNGQASPDLQAEAAYLRGVYRAGGHDDEAEVDLQDQALDFATLADVPPIKRLWADDHEFFPILETVGLGGPGGEGKTLVACGMATAVALGKSYLGIGFQQMKAALLLCEDRHDDAYLRQADINRYFGIAMKQLAGQLLILPRRGKRNALAVYNPDSGEMESTEFFGRLLAMLKVFEAKFVVIDTRSDVFRGNQNDEHQARDFVRFITDRIAEELGGVVVLLYQPSRAGRSDGSGESGSVQWDAAFRCRLVLRTADSNAGDDERVRHLEKKKSNWSAKGETIDMIWNKGVFWLLAEYEADELRDQSVPEVVSALNRTRRIFRTLFDKHSKFGPLSNARTSPNYAPKVFEQDGAAEGIMAPAFAKAMLDLLDAGELRREPYGPAWRNQFHLVSAGAVR
jgi:RecA-family ATPase